jgi:diacylglycerol kinase (ATP)
MNTAETLLIVNPVAGHGHGEKVFKDVIPDLEKKIPKLTIRHSSAPRHAIELGREAAKLGFRRILCLGGDGTPFEVLNGFYAEVSVQTPLELGLIPAGTGNSFLRDFGILSAAQALEALFSGNKRPVDLLSFSLSEAGRRKQFFSLNLIGIGLIADILETTNARFKFLGAAGYSLSVLVHLLRGLRNGMRIETPLLQGDYPKSALVICNSKYTGGKMMIAPNADTSDGRADLVIFRDAGRRDIVNIFRGVFSGNHAAHPKVEMATATEFRISGSLPLQVMADGELLGHTPLDGRVLPGVITLLA